MGGIVLDEEVEDGISVGAGEVVEVHVAEVYASERYEESGLRSIEPLGVERRGREERAGCEIEAVAGGVGGSIGSDAHELLQADEERDGRVCYGMRGRGEVGEERVDEVVEEGIGLAVAKDG